MRFALLHDQPQLKCGRPLIAPPEVSPRFGPSLPREIPQTNSIPCRHRLWIVLDQIVRQHEETGSKSMDMVHASQMKREGG